MSKRRISLCGFAMCFLRRHWSLACHCSDVPAQKDDRPNSRLRDYMTDKVQGASRVDDTVDGRNPANHLLSMKTYVKEDILNINWCRISSINSRNHNHTPKLKKEVFLSRVAWTGHWDTYAASLPWFLEGTVCLFTTQKDENVCWQVHQPSLWFMGICRDHRPVRTYTT